MPRTKTKTRPKRRRDYRDDPTPMSYQGLTRTEIRKELEGSITDISSRFLFTDMCELLKPRRIEQIRRDHDARAVLAFAAFTGPEAGADGTWDEIYKRADNYLKVRMDGNMSIDPLIIELRNLLGGLRHHQQKLEAARKAKQ